MGEDQFFNALPENLSGSGIKEKIVSYFAKAAAHLEKNNGVEILKQLYYPTNPKMTRGRDKDAKNPLLQLIKEGQKTRELSTEMSASDLSNYLYSLSSGIIFEWCLSDGGFSLQSRTKRYIKQALKAL